MRNFSEKQLVVSLDTAQSGMLAEAFLLDAGAERKVFCKTGRARIGGEYLTISLTENADPVVDLNCDDDSVIINSLDFPEVTFRNTGETLITLCYDLADKVAPGTETTYRTRQTEDPDGRKTLREFVKSPKVTAQIEQVRRTQSQGR